MTAHEEIVIASLREVFENKGLTPPELSEATPLDTSLGLESLDFAELVVRMEAATGLDPFATGSAPTIQTVADLAKVYDEATAA